MPRTRQAAAQRTLSFGNQRVTKPSVTPPVHNKANLVDSSAPSNSDQQIPIIKSRQDKTLAKPSKLQSSELVSAESLPEEDKQALKLGVKDLQRYWKKEEQSRGTKRVHQGDLDLEEKILRHFDISGQYGPCIGIDRLKRWRRANTLNLNPPIEVLTVLLKGSFVKQQSHVEYLLS
ncbi:hypothetical protein N7495_006477 [Penicillium taxi]|uniref:uncharacterized protein n=1 Tax=Penicillium taxi TaxID=168475 RepID=UPI00254516AD|nr:uncharacterized protein N7495_006477 [Penicillium taxi]KAJ5894786.1 hypothetical protein N7495_006477 [Penicillium taxi]